MKLLRIASAFLLLCFFSSSLSSQSQIPAAQLKTLDGKNVNIQDFIKPGRITVLSFWATWCSPCKRELDAIKPLYEEWQKLYGVDLVAISVDDTRSAAKIKPMVEQKGWKYLILSDPNQNLQKTLNFQTVPQTFVIDGTGNIVYTHSGYNTGDEIELEDHLKEIAAQ